MPFNLAAVLAVPFATWIFDWSGSYSIAYYYFLSFYAVAFMPAWFIRVPGQEPLSRSPEKQGIKCNM